MKIEINLTDDQVRELFAKDNKDTTVTYRTDMTPSWTSYPYDSAGAAGTVASASGACKPAAKSDARACQRLTDVYHGLLAAREALVVRDDSRRALDVIDGMIDDLDNILAEA